MHPKRFCLALMAIVFIFCSAATLLAQEDADPTDAVPTADGPESTGLVEIDRPENADTDPRAILPPGQSGQGVQIQDADYWFDRGVLLSVYGNEKSAVDAFQKAVQLAPEWSSPYFQMGVAYGENGQYVEALDAINRAIELEANKAAYYYGRGRIHLLAGYPLKALADLQKAADLGDRDAQRYLHKQAP